MRVFFIVAILAVGCGGPVSTKCEPGQTEIALHMASYCETPCETDSDCSADEPRCMAMQDGPRFCAVDVRPH